MLHLEYNGWQVKFAVRCLFIKFMLIISKGQMSYDKKQTSAIIFEQKDKSEPFYEETEPNSTGTERQTKQKMVVQQVVTNLIKIRSTPRLKNRAKLHLPQSQFQEEFRTKTHEKMLSRIHPNLSDDQQKSIETQTPSNKQTNPTTTFKDQQMQQNSIQEIRICQASIQLSQHKSIDPKNQLFLQSQAFHPRKAKRQLDNSQDECEQKIMEKEEEEDDEDDEDEQSCSDSQENEKHSGVKSKNTYGSMTKAEVITSPSIQLMLTQKKLNQFIQTPIKPGYQMKCIIELQEGFFGLGSKYHLKQKFQSKILISAKKQLISFTPSIILSLSKENHSRRNQNYMGSLESNFGGTHWTLACPEIALKLGKDKIASSEKIVMSANFKSSIMGSKSMREMKAMVMNPSFPRQKRADLSSPVGPDKKKHLVELTTAKPVLHGGKYQLDFKGVAKMASSKNFILCDEVGEQCLILGKQGQKTYQMNVQYPLSLLQGFSLCLASLEGKVMVN